MIASRFMVFTISVVTMPGAEKPRNASAPTRASAKVPLRCARLVTLAISTI